MNCEKIMTELMELEDYSHIPIKIRVHLLLCPICKKEAKTLIKAFNGMKEDSPYAAPTWIEESVMSKINSQNASGYRNISPFKWISSSALIFAGIILINYSHTFTEIKDTFGSSFSLPMAIVMGAAITSYLAIVVGCNYEGMMNTINKYRHILFK